MAVAFVPLLEPDAPDATVPPSPLDCFPLPLPVTLTKVEKGTWRMIFWPNSDLMAASPGFQ